MTCKLRICLPNCNWNFN